MFGSENIYGQSIVRLDDKGRMFLPKFTHVEKDDSLLILNKTNYLEIHREDLLDKKIIELEKMYIGLDNDRKRKAELEMLQIYRSILKKVKSDTQHRINLSGIGVVNNNFLCIGAKDHVILDVKCK